MRIRSELDSEIEIFRTRDKLGLVITQEDCNGDVDNVLGIELNQEQAIHLANYINSQFS